MHIKLNYKKEGKTMRYGHEPRTVYLKDGTKVKRVIRENAQGQQYIKCYGRIIFVEFYVGRYYQVYC